MLWQQFLEQDGLAGHRIAGSRTVRGFERRAHRARLASGQTRARFAPTRSQDGGVLHLRVRRPDGRRVELLLADLAGEQFERVREGRPLLGRAAVGAARRPLRRSCSTRSALSVPGESEIAVTRARRLLLGAAGLGGGARERARGDRGDQVRRARRDAARRRWRATRATCSRRRAGRTPRRSACAPRPSRTRAPSARGSGSWVSWLCGNDRPRTPLPVPEVAPGAQHRGLPRMSEPARPRLVFLGLPRTGKSTFLGAFWALVQSPVETAVRETQLRRRPLLRPAARRAGGARRGARPHGAGRRRGARGRAASSTRAASRSW